MGCINSMTVASEVNAMFITYLGLFKLIIS